jgi:apolipoprotein D and lipocalin family protein
LLEIKKAFKENPMRSALVILSLLTTLSTSACAQVENYKTVAHVDRNRFMGDWYVQAGRFTPLEKDVNNALERYTWNEEKQRIEIDFSYNQGSLSGPVKKIPQKGYIENKETNAHWKVSPLWPLKFDYLIVALDPEYQWTAIGVPSQKYLWVMTREKQLTKERLEQVLKMIEAEGYPVDNLTIVPQQKK